MIDVLHLYLRITDRLLELLYNDILSLDKNNHTIFESFLQKLNIKFKFNMVHENEFKKFNFTGDERMKIFKNIDQLQVFEILQRGHLKKKSMKDFQIIYENIRINKYQNGQQLLKDSEIWLNDFYQIYPSKYVTPYMHIFASHMNIFESNPNKFSLQGFEKFNGHTKNYYFTKTNKRTQYLKQLLCARIRLENFYLNKN